MGAHLMIILGVDASKYQGLSGMSHQRFDSLDDAGVRFGIFRATIGTQRDRSCEENLKRAKGRGWVFGTYHFLVPGDTDAQAEAYAAQLKSFGVYGDGLAVCDVEQAGLTSTMVRRFVRRFRELRPDQPLGCYTSSYKWRSLTGNMDGADLFDYLWNALWTQRSTRGKEDLPDTPPRVRYGGWKEARLWQYGMFRAQGVRLDGNAFYGTIDELRDLGIKKAPPLKERPNYRKGYNAVIEKALGSVWTNPASNGPAYDLGEKDAADDLRERIKDLRIGEPV